jgi:hypothetical protein
VLALLCVFFFYIIFFFGAWAQTQRAFQIDICYEFSAPVISISYRVRRPKRFTKANVGLKQLAPMRKYIVIRFQSVNCLCYFSLFFFETNSVLL